MVLSKEKIRELSQYLRVLESNELWKAFKAHVLDNNDLEVKKLMSSKVDSPWDRGKVSGVEYVFFKINSLIDEGTVDDTKDTSTKAPEDE